jgi:hypothetical protein
MNTEYPSPLSLCSQFVTGDDVREVFNVLMAEKQAADLNHYLPCSFFPWLECSNVTPYGRGHLFWSIKVISLLAFTDLKGYASLLAQSVHLRT